jgi:hypothetical protein
VNDLLLAGRRQAIFVRRGAERLHHLICAGLHMADSVLDVPDFVNGDGLSDTNV